VQHAPPSAWRVDELALTLAAPTLAGSSYRLSFAVQSVTNFGASGIRVGARRRQEQRNERVGALPVQDSGASDATTRAASLERTVLVAALARGERGSAAPAQERPCIHTNS
jgi:hypothetical protein